MAAAFADATTRADARCDAGLAFLFGRIDYERRIDVPYREAHFHLDRMRQLLARLGQPDREQRIIHVAGTKGKGSTAAMIAAVLSAAGYRTGLFSSPHLERIEERLAIDGAACTPARLATLVQRVRPVVERMDDELTPAGRSGRDSLGGPISGPIGGPIGPVTYFEILTAMALVHFADQGVQATVLEVGLGGRLDSTNVCRTQLSVITSISFDHTEQLGHTLAAIAAEKAGILRPGTPVVSGVTEDEPRDVIRRAARRLAVPLVELGADFSYQYAAPRRFDVSAAAPTLDFEQPVGRRHESWNNLRLSLLGRHQAHNAAVALAAVDRLRQQGMDISDGAVRCGLAQVRLPARVELIGRRPTVIVDTAHNVAAALALAETLEDSFGVGPHGAPDGRRRILLFAATQHKDFAGMLRVLVPRFDHLVLTRYHSNPRGVPAEEIWRAVISASPAASCDLTADPLAAWRLARSLAEPTDLICVTGSFFIAAELRSVILSEFGRDPSPVTPGAL